jgi:tetratricopeptide (TPR) repeat protein
MSDPVQQILDQIKELQKQAQLDRKRGDALRKANREAEAVTAYEAGSAKLSKGLEVLDAASWQKSSDLVAERAEMLGSLAGFAERIYSSEDTARGYEKALARYEEGAKVERDFQLASTYNRVNEIKYRLLSGQRKLSDIEPEIRMTANSLANALRTNQTLSDSGWAWADLGDCWALIGQLDEASRAYATFIAKADIKSPERTLDILTKIAKELDRHQDPGARLISESVSVLEGRLRSR